MAYETGTASGHTDLLDKLVTFLTTDATLVSLGQNWVANKEETISSYNMSNTDEPSNPYGSDFTDAYLEGPGLAGQDQVFVNLRTFEVPLDSNYSWMINISDDFDTNEDWEDQPNAGYSGSASNRVFRFFPTTNASMTYWFVASGRFFIVVLKIGGDFYSIYEGLYLPYALPSEFPYPVFMSGSTSNPDETIVDAVGSFWRPFSTEEVLLRQADGSWIESEYTQRPGVDNFSIWPKGVLDSGVSDPHVYSQIGNPDGSLSLLPLILFQYPPISQPIVQNILGELENAYSIPGLGEGANPSPVAEDTITIGGDTYLVIQNGDRTGARDRAAILLA